MLWDSEEERKVLRGQWQSFLARDGHRLGLGWAQMKSNKRTLPNLSGQLNKSERLQRVFPTLDTSQTTPSSAHLLWRAASCRPTADGWVLHPLQQGSCPSTGSQLLLPRNGFKCFRSDFRDQSDWHVPPNHFYHILQSPTRKLRRKRGPQEWSLTERDAMWGFSLQQNILGVWGNRTAWHLQWSQP